MIFLDNLLLTNGAVTDLSRTTTLSVNQYIPLWRKMQYINNMHTNQKGLVSKLNLSTIKESLSLDNASPFPRA